MPEELQQKQQEPEEGEQNHLPENGAENESSQEIGSTKTKKGASFFGPEAVLMFLFAGVFDLTGLLILSLGLDDFGILDFIGLSIIGPWMLWHSGIITPTKGTKKISGKVFKRLGLSFLGEIIPIFGNIAPCWTIAVYYTLKD